VETAIFFPQLLHERANQGVESTVLVVADDLRQSPPEITDVLGDDNAVLPEKTADLIDESDAIRNQTTANPVNRLHRQLFGGLDRHEAHVWSADRLAYTLRIIPVVLVGLHIGRDELRTDQSDVVTRSESACAQKWAPFEASMPTRQGGRFAKNADTA
jgi:hypothetical protein